MPSSSSANAQYAHQESSFSDSLFQTSPCSLASTFKRASSSQPLHFQSLISFHCSGNHFRSLFPTSPPLLAASPPTPTTTLASSATTRVSTSFTQRPLSFLSTTSSHPSTSLILSRSSSLFWLPSEVSSRPLASSPPHLHGRLEPTPKCAKKYGVIVVIVAVGYGYVWWKGWKLPDMMFATRRSLSDACNSVARQLEDVYSSISAAQRQLSSKITSVDRDVNKIVEISQATQEEVTILRGRSKLIGDEFQSVRDIVQTLESKLIEIEGKQDITTLGVKKLCDRARELENGRPTELVQASRYTLSRTTLELPGITPSSRSGSLHPLPLEPPSPSDSNGSHKVNRQNSVSASGLKEFNGVTKLGESSRSPKVSNGIGVSEDLGSWSSSNGVPGRRFSGSVLTRQRSATNGLAQQVLSSGQQC